MLVGPVEFHLLFRQDAWLSEVPWLSMCVEQNLTIRTGCPCHRSFGKYVCPALLHSHMVMSPMSAPMETTVHQLFSG